MKGKLAGMIVTLACVATTVPAEPVTPARGTALRAELMDTVRAHVVNDLGAPIEFVVNTLLVEDGRGLAMLSAQRPGGGAIDISQTPLVLRDGIAAWEIDGPEVVAFLYLQSGNWYVDDYSVGATDAWWAGGPFCREYASVLPAQVCP
ncbi:hypothetical protein SAMN04488515_0132 [Cognatiyoonia koreensis]|uniref:Uncharacterized protein n=1 Tax=Cognatiyoonia koreensis TaxID=364200 RepID=A0A1I0MPE4_9RHOB|nr:hypothetical protein [Cognatiyoonia koreensis]SEV89907.1 hypothetical protein SAMN04488515_0132 [Cognatiyoonia koreensis]